MRKVIVAIITCLLIITYIVPINASTIDNSDKVILIDPGHGGIDGGAKSMCIILCIYQIVDFCFQVLFPFAIHHTTSRKFRIELYQVKQLFIIPLVYLVKCVNLFGLVVYHIGMIAELFA